MFAVQGTSVNDVACLFLAMPKATPIIPKYSHVALNKATGLRERIAPSKAIREKYATLCAPHKVKRPEYKKPRHPGFAPGELEAINADNEQWLADRAELSRLVLKKRKLEDRLSDPGPSLLQRVWNPTPLEQRLEPYYKSLAETDIVMNLVRGCSDEEGHRRMDQYELEIQQQRFPALPNINFKKRKLQDRTKEMSPVIGVTLTRLQPVFEYLDEGYARNDLPEAVLDGMWKWYNQLLQLEEHFEELGQQWKKNKFWRDLKGLCSRIGKVDMTNFSERKKDIVLELHGLDIHVPEFKLDSD